MTLVSCESEVEQALRASGRRVTVQRSKILAAVRHSDGHASADQIFERVRTEDPHAGISLSTVYRTLGTLRQMQLVSELDSVSGTATYERADSESSHHHLVCRECGEATEVELPALGRIEVEIEERTGFEPDIRHLGISGLCAACRG